MPLLDEAVRQQLSQHPYALQAGVPTPSAAPTPSAPWRPSPMASTLMILGALLPMMAGKFGKPEIPDAWREENALYRDKLFRESGGETSIPYGTRVNIRPYAVRESGLSRRGAENLFRTHPEFTNPETGTVVDPKTPEAGEPGSVFARGGLRGTRGPEYVPVRKEGSDVWHWRHRDSLEILPPRPPFPLGSQATYKVGGYMARGMVSEPPPSAPAQPGPDWVWMDVDGDYWPPLGEEVTRYPSSNTWGSWFHKDDLETLAEPPGKKKPRFRD